MPLTVSRQVLEEREIEGGRWVERERGQTGESRERGYI
jgi:hypothetical protein